MSYDDFRLSILSTPVQIGPTLNGINNNEYFGDGLAISENGRIIAIGAPNVWGGSGIGYVKVYQYNDVSYVQLGQTLTSSYSGDNFGRSISLSYDGTVLAIGAQFRNSSNTGAGSAEVYAWNGSSWVIRGSTFNGQQAYSRFGANVALSADGTVFAAAEPLLEVFRGSQRSGCL